MSCFTLLLLGTFMNKKKGIKFFKKFAVKNSSNLEKDKEKKKKIPGNVIG